MKIVFIGLLLLINIMVLQTKPLYVVSSYPAQMILQELTGNKVEIQTLIPVGGSPHTFSPKPSQMKKVQEADCFFYIADNMDNWAKKIQAKKKIRMMDLLPKKERVFFSEMEEHEHHHGHEDGCSHNHGEIDPHFWTSPVAVKSMVPGLLKKITELNPDLSEDFNTNAKKFTKKLDELNTEIKSKMSKYKNENVFLFHPSFLYYLKQYGLKYAGSIETSPGKEPSAKYTMNLVKRIKKANAKALYTEPQLPKAPVEAIAEASGLKIYLLDPVGGEKGRTNYSDFILYNTNTLAKSLNKK